MSYNTATIDVTLPSGVVESIDLDGLNTLGDLTERVRELAEDPGNEGEQMSDDELLEAVSFTNPQGFAKHLFDKASTDSVEAETHAPTASFDELAEAWNNETDEDRREAMGEYLDDMGANDLSDFDEAYQGQYDSGAAFAQDTVDLPANFPSWIVIDWERTWESNVRHDYHITDSGHVFRHL